ncbi:MAG: tRNA pseudouridine(13) synthase TruD [Candidatus Micrarchaeaceae archaeon]
MLTLSRTKGTGGEIKNSPEDFVVREITKEGFTLMENTRYSPEAIGEAAEESGKFTKFILQKTNWDTVQALIRIAKITGRGKRSIGYCGTKDRKSISVQTASIFGASPEQLQGIRLKDISINGSWRSATEAGMGENIGNAFSVTIRDCRAADAAEETVTELGSRMPNYYDRQRFGMRLNNFDVGMCILRGDFEGAVMKLLTDTKRESNQESISARKRLESDRDFKAALGYFPASLRTERMVIEYLSRYDNYANSLRKLPRGTLLMLVHSVQSLIFNASLQERIKEGDLDAGLRCRKNAYGFPDMGSVGRDGDIPIGNLIGYETRQENVDEYESGVLERLELNRESFKIKGMPELSTKGAFRALISPVRDMACSAGGGTVKMEFSIPAGSYATILINEITKSDGLRLEDIAGPKA